MRRGWCLTWSRLQMEFKNSECLGSHWVWWVRPLITIWWHYQRGGIYWDLRKILGTMLSSTVGEGAITFIDDGAGAHKSIMTASWYQNNNIHHWKLPAQSLIWTWSKILGVPLAASYMKRTPPSKLKMMFGKKHVKLGTKLWEIHCQNDIILCLLVFMK